MIRILLWCAIGLVGAESLKLDFIRTATTDAPLPKRGSGFETPLLNDFPRQRYLINITVGNPPQAFAVTLDTGSADLWVPSPNSTGCAPHCPPTFDPAKSKTYRDTGYIFNITYGLGPGTALLGPYFNDTVRIGPAAISNMTGKSTMYSSKRTVADMGTLALGNVPSLLYGNGQFGIMGLGSPLQEALKSNPGLVAKNASFPLIYDLLYHHGYIDKRIFSIWLDDETASTGSILFGGIDHSKYRGDLKYVPVAHQGTQVFPDWRLNLTSIAVNDQKSHKVIPVTNSTIPAVLDSGSPNIYFPPDIANAITANMNVTMHNGFPYASCHLRQSKSSVQFRFDRGTMKGPEIDVPYGQIIYPYGDPANIGPVNAPDGTELCYVGLIGAEVPFGLIGDPFIRSAYVVYDAEDLQVGLAPARYC